MFFTPAATTAVMDRFKSLEELRYLFYVWRFRHQSVTERL